MSFAIRIKEDSRDTTPWRYEREFRTQAEFANFEKKCLNRKEPFPSLTVIRRDTWAHLCEDLFFPSLIHTAFKTEKIFLILRHLMVDLLTLPVRLFIVCFTKENKKSDHPLYKYLFEQGADFRILDPDHVYLEKTFLSAPHGIEKVGETLNYIPLPDYATPQVRSEYYPSGKRVEGLAI